MPTTICPIRIQSINNHRCVIGRESASGYIWTATTGNESRPQPVGTAVQEFLGVNDDGYVVGWEHTNVRAPIVRSPSGKKSILKRLQRGPAIAHGINIHQLVVGRSDAAGVIWGALDTIDRARGRRGSLRRLRDNFHAVLWDEGVLYDLNNLIPADSGWVLRIANDINDAGQLVGQGASNGEEHAFLLTPIEEKTKTRPHQQPGVLIFKFLSNIGIKIRPSGN